MFQSSTIFTTGRAQHSHDSTFLNGQSLPSRPACCRPEDGPIPGQKATDADTSIESGIVVDEPIKKDQPSESTGTGETTDEEVT